MTLFGSEKKMSENQLNIKSSTIEKGLELAKGFIDKLIGPTIEEVGLLFADNIKYFRFKNQVKILLKAKKYVESKNIDTKEIPLKILVPLLEKASLEESEELQDKWAKMITNLADSESNLQNQIFPYILSQLSIEEFNGLKGLLEKEKGFWNKSKILHELRAKEGNNFFPSENVRKLQDELDVIQQEGFIVSNDFTYELSNIERLGLMKKTLPNVIVEEFNTGSRLAEYGESEEWHQLETKYESLELNTYRITELGVSFIEICELKTNKASG